MRNNILFLLFVGCIVVGCSKNEPSNQYYTPQQIEVINTLCKNEWKDFVPWNRPVYEICTAYFDSIPQHPWYVIDTYSNTNVEVDGIFSVWVNSIWTYYYWVLSLDCQSIRLYGIAISDTDRHLQRSYIIDKIIEERPTIYISKLHQQKPNDYQIVKGENGEIYLRSVRQPEREFRIFQQPA